MLIAQDLLVSPRMFRTGLVLGFASDTDCIGLTLGSPRMLIAQDFNLGYSFGLTPLMPV